MELGLLNAMVETVVPDSSEPKIVKVAFKDPIDIKEPVDEGHRDAESSDRNTSTMTSRGELKTELDQAPVGLEVLSPINPSSGKTAENKDITEFVRKPPKSHVISALL